CKFCDTDFVGTDGEGGGKFEDALVLARAINALWPHEKEKKGAATPYVVFTGGEPLLQLDDALTDEVHKYGFEIAIESNGTLEAPTGVDWICISPKAGAPLVQTRGQELKLVYPQAGAEPERFSHLAFENFLLQPMWGDKTQENMAAAARYCMA